MFERYKKFLPVLRLENKYTVDKIKKGSIYFSILLIVISAIFKAILLISSALPGYFPGNTEFMISVLTGIIPVTIEKILQVVIMLGILKIIKHHKIPSFKELFNALAVSNIPRIIVGAICLVMSFFVFGFNFDQIYNYDTHTILQTVFSVIYSALIFSSSIWSITVLFYFNSKIAEVSFVKSVVITIVSLVGAFVVRSSV